MDKSTQGTINQPNTISTASGSNRWSDWSYAIDTSKSIDSDSDSKNELNSTLVIKSEFYESADDFFNPQTLIIKEDKNLAEEENNQPVVLDNSINEFIDVNNTSANKTVNALFDLRPKK